MAAAKKKGTRKTQAQEALEQAHIQIRRWKDRAEVAEAEIKRRGPDQPWRREMWLRAFLHYGDHGADDQAAAAAADDLLDLADKRFG